MKKWVGEVSEEEKNNVRALYERKNGLIELSKIMGITDSNKPQYEKLVTDIVEASINFQHWWDEMSMKYQWENASDGNWEIDFHTNKVYLVTNN